MDPRSCPCASALVIGMVTVLAETAHAARAAHVDMQTLRQVLDAGPMASIVSRTKLDKLVGRDFSPQAAIRDVSTIAELVLGQCKGSSQDTPLIRHCASLYRRALDQGHGDEDMAAVVHAFEPVLSCTPNPPAVNP